MAISEKMILALDEHYLFENPILVVQDIINAVWTEFDFTDLSEIEQDKPYLIMHKYGISDARLEDWEGDISWHNDEGLLFGDVTHYANPNDLLYVPKQTGEDDEKTSS